MPDIEDRDYHSAFKSGLEVLLWPYREQIEIREEIVLKKQGIRVDLLLLKPDSNIKIDNDICRIFRTHNILEYKRPDDDLDIDVFAKVLAYANLYKSLSTTADAIPYEEITATIYRHAYPRELIKKLESMGLRVKHVYAGVYYIIGATLFPIQILVGKELDKKEYSMLRVLMPQARKEDIENFTKIIFQEQDAAYKDYIDKIYQVSITANRELYDQIKKEDPKMCEALRELMKDEIRQELAEREIRGEQNRTLKDISNLMDTMDLTPIKAMEALKIPVEEQEILIKLI